MISAIAFLICPSGIDFRIDILGASF